MWNIEVYVFGVHKNRDVFQVVRPVTTQPNLKYKAYYTERSVFARINRKIHISRRATIAIYFF